MATVEEVKARPQFRNTGQLAKSLGRPRLVVDTLTVVSGTERIDAGRCRLYTAENQARIEEAVAVFGMAEGLDMTGREELRQAWEAYTDRVREIADRQRGMIDPAIAAGD